MGRRAETKLFETKKLRSPHNGSEWFMIEGRPIGKRERYYFARKKEAKKAASDRNRLLAAFGSQTSLPDADDLRCRELGELLLPARGEKVGMRGALREFRLADKPLTPTLSP